MFNGYISRILPWYDMNNS